RHALAGGQHQQAVPARAGQALLANPGQGRQEVVLREPVDVVRVAGQHRTVRGGPAYAGRADLGTDDAVDQGGLARAGGADERDQDGRGGPADPRQQVVVNLAEELGAFGLDLVGAVDLEDERDGGDPLSEVEQGGLEKARVHADVRLRLLLALGLRLRFGFRLGHGFGFGPGRLLGLGFGFGRLAELRRLLWLPRGLGFACRLGLRRLLRRLFGRAPRTVSSGMVTRGGHHYGVIPASAPTITTVRHLTGHSIYI